MRPANGVKTENTVSQKELSGEQLIAYFKRFCWDYLIASIEVPLADEDFDSFTEITRQIGQRIQTVGDDLFVTNPKRL